MISSNHAAPSGRHEALSNGLAVTATSSTATWPRIRSRRRVVGWEGVEVEV
jgi:hypothetical protein